MKFELKRKIGDAEWRFFGESNGQKAFFNTAQFLTELPTQCDHCGGSDLSFQVRRPQNYEYFLISCGNKECRYELEYGQHKEGGTLFKKDWNPPYDPNAPQNARNGQGGWATQPNPNNPQGRQQQNNQPLPPPPEFAPPGDIIDEVPF